MRRRPKHNEPLRRLLGRRASSGGPHSTGLPQERKLILRLFCPLNKLTASDIICHLLAVNGILCTPCDAVLLPLVFPSSIFVAFPALSHTDATSSHSIIPSLWKTVCHLGWDRRGPPVLDKSVTFIAYISCTSNLVLILLGIFPGNLHVALSLWDIGNCTHKSSVYD